jgi:signal peptidase I
MSLLSVVVVGPVAAAVLIVVVLRRRFIVVTVTGSSMAPVLLPGDRVLVRRRAMSGLRVGQIVVFGRPPDDCLVRDSDAPPSRVQWAIKRVAALPGDTVPAVARSAVGGHAVVPPGLLVVLGDSAGSIDSRTWGFLSAPDVLGVAVRPLNRSRRAG